MYENQAKMSACVGTTERKGSVTDRLAMQEQMIDELRSAINVLHERLGFILQPSHPCPETISKEQEQPCDLARIINNNNQKIGSCSNSIREIMDRCEL